MTLSDQNITLRPLKDEDQEQLARIANNKKIWNNVRDYFPHPYSLDDAKGFIEMNQKQDPRQVFGIEYQGVLCGCAGVHVQTDVYHRSGELGYWIGEAYWGKGIATAAVKLLTKYGFEDLDLIRLYAGVFSFNDGSKKVLEKVGYELEAISKNAVFKSGVICDEYRYVKLRTED